MTTPDVVFLFDVDNTSLDDDRIEKNLRRHLEREFGGESRDRYFAIFEDLRAELGYADYLGALQRYRLQDLCDPRLLIMSSYPQLFSEENRGVPIAPLIVAGSPDSGLLVMTPVLNPDP